MLTCPSADRLQRQAFDNVEEMVALGEKIDAGGSVQAAVNHHVQCAEGQYWANRLTLSGPGPIAEKLRAWARGPQSSAVYRSETWALTHQILKDLWAWELKFLRRVLRLKWNRGRVDYITYLRTSAAKIRGWMTDFKITPVHVRVLIYHHKAAWREKEFTSGTGRQTARMSPFEQGEGLLGNQGGSVQREA